VIARPYGKHLYLHYIILLYLFNLEVDLGGGVYVLQRRHVGPMRVKFGVEYIRSSTSWVHSCMSNSAVIG